jgi:hypothetical protein
MLAVQHEAKIKRRVSPVKCLIYLLGKSRRGVKEMPQFSLEEIMRGTRYHEAGHAVAAHYHWYDLTRVIATYEEARIEYLCSEPGGYFDSWRRACITMAGPLAGQRALCGEMSTEPWDIFLWNAEDDLELVEIGFDPLDGSDDSKLLQWLYKMGEDPDFGAEPEESYWIVVRDCRRLVASQWPAIEAVARALEEHDTLDGPEAVRIINQTSRGRFDLAALRSRLPF